MDKDLRLWEAGDLTEIGEKGLTLRYDSYIVIYSPNLLTIEILAVGKRQGGIFFINSKNIKLIIC